MVSRPDSALEILRIVGEPCGRAQQMRTDPSAALAEKEAELKRQAEVVRERVGEDAETVVATRAVRFVQALHDRHEMMTKREENMLLRMAETQHPAFYQTLTDIKKGLTRAEVLLGILVGLHFTPAECGVLLGASAQRITNLRSQVNGKLFGNPSAKKLDYNIRKRYPPKPLSNPS